MRVVAFQSGPMVDTSSDVLTRAFESVGDLTPDLVVFPELFPHPFWCVGLGDNRYFSWAESISGPTMDLASRFVADLGCHAVVPLFERGDVAGEYYNSAVVIGPDGQIVPGRLPGGEEALTYRKCAISSYRWGDARNDEKHYFREGPGYPVFPTAIGNIGVLICYDRWFPEAWRVLALQGADVVCVPTASSGPGAGLFHPSLRTWAAENALFVVAANRSGVEDVEGTKTEYFGLSSIISPRGEMMAAAQPGDADAAVMADVEIDEVQRVRLDLTMYRDRRPELYRTIVDE